jgi:tyrosine-protein phosphatase SIW14
MKKINLLIRVSICLAISFLGLTVGDPAQTTNDSFQDVKIKNFGQMDERFFRGAQPLPEDFQSLRDLGIQTIVDLRNDPMDYEKSKVEVLGMKYINIPMSGWRTPKEEQIEDFLNLINNPETGAFFVHCKAGIHRTGVIGAVYRFKKYGWDYNQTYQEMKDYNFSAGLFHQALKGYVKDYAKRLEAKKIPLPIINPQPAN